MAERTSWPGAVGQKQPTAEDRFAADQDAQIKNGITALVRKYAN